MRFPLKPGMTGAAAVILYPPAGPACAQEHKLVEWKICINKLICLFLQKYDNMRRDLLIELLEEGDKVSLYSPRFSGEEYTEFEKFLLDYKDDYPSDVAQIVYRLDIVKRDGAADRHFRYEGRRSDRVMALPSYLESSKLRVYLLNIESKILILGNGGLKTTRTYEEDSVLNGCVEVLQKIDIQIRNKEMCREIIIKGSNLLGELSFTIDI